MLRRLVVLGLALAGCGLPASIRTVMQQPDGYAVSAPPPAELLQRVSDKGPDKWATEGLMTIAIDPVTGRIPAAPALGIADPAVELQKQVVASLRERGYAAAMGYSEPIRLTRDPPELSSEALAAMKTPYLLHLQATVEAGEAQRPIGLEATLVVFDRSGLMRYRSRCSIGRDENAPTAPHDQIWQSLERRCTERLLKDF